MHDFAHFKENYMFCPKQITFRRQNPLEPNSGYMETWRLERCHSVRCYGRGCVASDRYLLMQHLMLLLSHSLQNILSNDVRQCLNLLLNTTKTYKHTYTHAYNTQAVTGACLCLTLCVSIHAVCLQCALNGGQRQIFPVL